MKNSSLFVPRNVMNFHETILLKTRIKKSTECFLLLNCLILNCYFAIILYVI